MKAKLEEVNPRRDTLETGSSRASSILYPVSTGRERPVQGPLAEKIRTISNQGA